MAPRAGFHTTPEEGSVLHAWISIERDDPRLAELRTKLTVCRRRDHTEEGFVWTDADPAEAWAKYDERSWGGRVSLSADWDRIQISPLGQPFGIHWELSRPPVKVLILSAWIAEDGEITEDPEATRDAAWTEGFEGDWDQHAQRAAQWIACIPNPKDPFNYTYSHRVHEARNRATTRLKRWAYEQLETSGVPMQWHIEDHRIHLRHGRYRTRVRLTGSDFEAVRAEWQNGLPHTCRRLLDEDRFRRILNTRGNVVDLRKIKAGPSLLERLRRELARDATPKPSTKPFRTTSWVAWTCPDTGAQRRGIVVGESLSRSKVVAVRILPDDGGEEIEAYVAGQVGKLTTCGKIRKGDPGTVTPAPVPALV
ncbi:hypothetical protein [Streptomyces massasporeus]|uniref:hypothetical protein n=1 Tax=Streptomyces massasporeus TaxID=67324 RepID=UPI00331C4555